MTTPSEPGRRDDSPAGSPPPWQRGSAAGSQGKGDASVPAGSGGTDSTRTDRTPSDGSRVGGSGPERGDGPRRTTAVVDAPTSQIRRADVPTDMPDLSTARRTSTDGPRSPRTDARPSTPTPRTSGRGPRRAALQVKHIDPWSALKLSLVLSVALFLVWMIAVGVLYLVLDGMGVWSSINKTFTDFVTVSDPAGGGGALIGPGRVFGVAAVIGLVNVVLFTALATLSSFVYNLSADLAGGVEVTLTERD
jgi:hypothetical protein